MIQLSVWKSKYMSLTSSISKTEFDCVDLTCYCALLLASVYVFAGVAVAVFAHHLVGGALLVAFGGVGLAGLYAKLEMKISPHSALYS